MQNLHSRRFRALLNNATASVLAVASSYAIAEEADRQIEEVIVTAQRASESIQKVPIAVTALSGDMLDDRQIIGAPDLQMNAPNVSFSVPPKMCVQAPRIPKEYTLITSCGVHDGKVS